MKPILFNTEMVRAILDGRKTITRRNPFHFRMKGEVSAVDDGLSLGEYYTGHIETGACLYKRGRHGVWQVVSNVVKPKYNVGDVLYVRETWQHAYNLDEDDQIIDGTDRILYKASPEDWPNFTYWVDENGDYKDEMPWRPSIHMPKEAARIFLHVTNVKTQRLQDITEDQAMSEGITSYSKDGKLNKYAVNADWWIDYHRKHKKEFKGTYWQDMPRSAREAFQHLWNSTIKKKNLPAYGWDANPWVFAYEFERCEKPKEAHK